MFNGQHMDAFRSFVNTWTGLPIGTTFETMDEPTLERAIAAYSVHLSEMFVRDQRIGWIDILAMQDEFDNPTIDSYNDLMVSRYDPLSTRGISVDHQPVVYAAYPWLRPGLEIDHDDDPYFDHWEGEQKKLLHQNELIKKDREYKEDLIESRLMLGRPINPGDLNR